jgi:carboxypeptidase PM20D1
VDEVIQRIKSRVGEKIEVKALQSTEPTSISPTNHPSFIAIKDAIKTVYPNFKATAPYLMIAATDSRLYHGLAEGVYRINPFESAYADLDTVHADDERVSLDSYYKGIEFFKVILKNASKA